MLKINASPKVFKIEHANLNHFFSVDYGKKFNVENFGRYIYVRQQKNFGGLLRAQIRCHQPFTQLVWTVIPQIFQG